MRSLFSLSEAVTNEFTNLINKNLVEQLAFKAADMIIRTFHMKSTRGHYSRDSGQVLGYIDWTKREIGLPSKNMLIENRLHVIAHELTHGLINQLEAKDPGIIDRVWQKYLKYDTRFIHQDTFSHVHKYQHRDEIEQKEECLAEEITNRRYVHKAAEILLKHFDDLIANEPQLQDIEKLKYLPSHLNQHLHSLYINYLENIIYMLHKQGYVFSEAMHELRSSPHGDHFDVAEEEDMKLLNYIEERAREVAKKRDTDVANKN
jgi:hypothetical protein